MRLAVTGSSGFVGSALTARLEQEGHEVVRLLRPGSEPRPSSAYWDPQHGTIDEAALEGVDAVVHLAGAGIGVRPWTRKYKATILRSRVDGTGLLSTSVARLVRAPSVFVSASAIGWYGDRGDEILTEQSAPGEGFRADVCRQWEGATEPAVSVGIRVVKLRLGIVLGSGGGFLRPFLLPSRFGLRMQFGDGQQFLSWISRPDVVSAILKAIRDESLSGPVNTTGPNPVRNKEFARELSRALGRHTIGHIPKLVLEMVAGRERAREVLLSSQRALPAKLLAAGFVFQHTEIGEGLRSAI